VLAAPVGLGCVGANGVGSGGTLVTVSSTALSDSGGTTGTSGCSSRVLAEVVNTMVRVRNRRQAMALFVVERILGISMSERLEGEARKGAQEDFQFSLVFCLCIRRYENVCIYSLCSEIGVDEMELVQNLLLLF
jgi:hypothetical protein